MRISTRNAVCLFLLASCLGLPTHALANEDARADNFDTTIAPLLASRCFDCHSGSEPKGGLDLSQRAKAMAGGDSGAVVVPGKPGESLLWEHVSTDEMPPKKPLPEAEKKTLHDWIAAGAPWGTDPIDPFRFTSSSRAGYDFWSLQPIRDVAVPNVKDNGRVRNPIDAFLLAKLKERGLEFSRESSPRQLVRRLYFDLIGLPPTPEEVSQFEKDPSDDAYRQLVDRLLASPHYGERWGRHWLDVARYGESDGFERNGPRRNSWHYRDWVIQAFNNDMPFDQFARMQIAGDVLTSNAADGLAAAGFLVAGVHNTVVGSSPTMKKLARQDELEEIAAAVSQTYLGMTVNCARCHNHKFDPISQTEYYRFIASLEGVNHGERDVQRVINAEQLVDVRTRIGELAAQLAKMELAARERALAARRDKPQQKAAPPKPLASWSFEANLNDALGNLHGEAKGQARIEGGALVVDGSSFVATQPLQKDLVEKTLEAWVQLDGLDQRGGAPFSVQTPDGTAFDAIVFGEKEPRRWMAGSDFFRRTDTFAAPQESEAGDKPVHVAIVYQPDGTIIGYRNGAPYGKAYRSSGPVKFVAGKAQIVFGMRHSPPGPNKMLRGRIFKAQLYDRALRPDEVAASAGIDSDFVPDEELVKQLSSEQIQQRSQLQSELKQLRQTEARLAQSGQKFKMHTVVPRGLSPTHVLLRGDVNSVGPQVSPGALGALGKAPADFQLPAGAPDAERRLKLAQWISAADNPLFARVIVNRVWHYHFGIGIVETPNDLGFNGGRPSHPDLLDWLAAQFLDQGQRLKAMHRLIVTSSAYRQSSRFRPDAARVDAGNRLLWRKSPRRLEAEALRDAMLLVSGQLNRAAGGPGFVDVNIRENNGTTYYTPFDRDDPALNRRTVYRFVPRGGRSALLDTFDCPDPSATAPRRTVTTTPLQALTLMNNALVLRLASHFAKRVEREVGTDREKQILRAYQLALARAPDDEEKQLAMTLANDYGLPALCRALVNSSEFVVVP